MRQLRKWNESSNFCFDECTGADDADDAGDSRKWEQVMTSVSTGVLGTGVFLSSVSATYGTIAGSDDVSVLNCGFINL